MNTKKPKKSKTNTLQAVLDRQDEDPESLPQAPQSRARDQPAVKGKGRGRINTVLIGGHFPPSVAKQLGILAAEEGTNKQTLIAEALNLLFVKKGKKTLAI